MKAVAGIREPGTVRRLLMAAYLLLVITCYTTTKAVRDSLFITEIGPAQLPYLYVLSAAGMAIVSAAYTRAFRRIGLYSAVQATSILAAVSLVAFWWLIAYQQRASFYVLYVWVSLFGAITASQAWSIANHVFDAREARRSFAWIGLGGVLGGIAGGVLARFVAPWQGTETLLPVCAILILLTVVILHGIVRAEASNGPILRTAGFDSENSSGSAIFAQIRQSRYVTMMVALLFVGVIVEAFLDYEFKVISYHAFDSRDRLTSFFGSVASYGGVLALLVQTLLTGRILKRFGVGPAILFLPTALCAGFLLVAAKPALWAITIVKLIDGGLSYSVHRSGMELLYVPIPAKLRASVKALIDLLVDRVGRATGGGLLLLLTAGLSLSLSSLSLVAAICLGAWIGMAFIVRQGYVGAFRTALEKKVIEPDVLDVRSLDSTTTATLIQALASSDERQVLYALDLLGETHPSRWKSHVPILIEHHSSAVRCRVIRLLTERNVPSPSCVSGKLSDPDVEVRVEAVRHLCAHPAEERLKEFLSHSDYRVVLAAIHCMTEYALGKPDLISPQLIERASTTTGEHRVAARTAAARALAIAPIPDRTSFLDRLLEDTSPDVVEAAVRTVGEVRYASALPVLISMLARARLRREVRQALLKFGDTSLSQLRDRLQDKRTPIEVRTRIPKVLSFFGTQEVADFLIARVHHSDPRLDVPSLKALNRLRGVPEIAFNQDRVASLIEEESGKHRRLSLLLRALRSVNTRDHGASADELYLLLEKAINERLAECIERVFRLLGLIYSPADIYGAYFSLTSRPALRASAIEFLDNLVDLPLRALVIPLLEEPTSGDDTLEMKEGEILLENPLQDLLAGDDDWLATIARELISRWSSSDVLSSRIA